MNPPDDLDTKTDDELSEAFAVEVAGWRYDPSRKRLIRGFLVSPQSVSVTCWRAGGYSNGLTPYASDARAVLLWAEKVEWDCSWNKLSHYVRIFKTPRHNREDSQRSASAPTFARALAIAMLRHKRILPG